MIKSSTIVHQIKSDNEKRLELVIEAAAVGVWDWEIQTGEVTFNQRWAEISGYTSEELTPMTFEIWKDGVHPDDAPIALERIEKHLDGTLDCFSAELRVQHKEGGYVWALASGRVVEWDLDGRPTRMLGAYFDVSERKASEQEFLVASQLLQETQAISNVGGWELNLETGDLYWTDETYRLHDTSPDEFNPTVDAGVSYFLPGSREKISLAIEQAIEHGSNYDLELETFTTKGRKIDVRTTCHVTQVNGKSVRLTGIFQDISEQKAIQRKLELTNLNLEKANSALSFSAHYDELTGLPNRTLLSDRMQQAMIKCQRNNQSMAVAFIDLDGFKWINDSYGHSVGDQFLRLITQKLKQSLREGDTLARIGGDEFVAVIDELGLPEDAHKVLWRLLEAAANELNINGNRLKTTASIGVTFYPENNCSPDQLLRSADQAMYKAKQLGKDCWHIFDIQEDVAVKSKIEEIERIRLALYNEEFVLFYQPKIDLRSKQLIGMEALIRWNHPEQGILPPVVFLPIIEHDLLSIELGEWVIHTALQQLECWRSSSLEVPISVNISPMQLQSSDFVSRLEHMLNKFPSRNLNNLEFEILESSALEDIDLATEVINLCKKLGVKFSIDDFGTGYSSLSYLKKIPAEYLKIDQAFVRDMLADEDDCTIIKGIIELSKAFNLKVIAEGVETPAHGEVLTALGCFLAQGYGIAKPMPASDMPVWFKRWQENPVLVDGSL